MLQKCWQMHWVKICTVSICSSAEAWKLRVPCAYHIVSESAFLVTTGDIPTEFLAKKRSNFYKSQDGQGDYKPRGEISHFHEEHGERKQNDTRLQFNQAHEAQDQEESWRGKILPDKSS